MKVYKINLLVKSGNEEIIKIEEGLIKENDDLFHILKKIKEELVSLKENEEKEIRLSPKEGFGERRRELIRVIPYTDFKASKITPYPGLTFSTEDGLTGRILSVNSGRVLVDFNNPWAGKELDVKMKLWKILEDKEDIIKEVLNVNKIEDFEISKEGESYNITIKKDIDEEKMKIIENAIKDLIPDLSFKLIKKID